MLVERWSRKYSGAARMPSTTRTSPNSSGYHRPVVPVSSKFRVTSPVTRSAPVSSAASSSDLQAWYGSSSSLSRNITWGAAAASMPALRGAPQPPLLTGRRRQRTRRSDAASRRAVARVASVEQSSTMITSRLRSDWPSTDRTARGSRSASL
ncbi:hypothetical protein SMD11_4227 [Streptomyces albireticuli]|uniref:Uncharacterized protein n=1 Tax=Streptomyces albireticuli TaxID=1940 RepID=A0A1Z2L6B7_9ACTN|nr:hypothetical protein SMD11_4227 [Streptomyces albireticuli]